MDLEETRAFLAVLDHGSFKAAAEVTKQPRATLRRRVEALEARAGVALLARSHSGVIPTPAGELLARASRAILRETTALLETLRAVGDEPSGELRIGVPAELPPHGCAIVCGLLQARFPRLHVHVRVSPNPIAELLEHVDLALHVGARPDAGRVQVRALTQVSDGLWASRTYVQRHGLPRSLDDLRGHTLLGSEPGELQRWPLCDGGDVEVAARQTSSDPQLLHRLVSLGFGVALLSEVDGPAFADEDDALVPILEGVVGRTRALSVVVPDVLAETAKLRAVVGQLERIVTGHDAPTRPQPSPSESLSVVPARQMM